MDTIAKRVKAARELRGLTQAELADILGSGQSSIASIENGRNASSKLLIPISIALRVNPAWLFRGIGQMLESDAASEAARFASELSPDSEKLYHRIARDLQVESSNKRKRRIWVGLYDYHVDGAAIDWRLRDKESLPFESEFFERVGSDPEDCRLLAMRGDSMEPFLFPGDLVMVDTRRTALRDGLVYAVHFESEPLIKQVLKEAGGGLVLHSYNPRLPDRRISADQLDRIIIVGEVIFRAGGNFDSR